MWRSGMDLTGIAFALEEASIPANETLVGFRVVKTSISDKIIGLSIVTINRSQKIP